MADKPDKPQTALTVQQRAGSMAIEAATRFRKLDPARRSRLLMAGVIVAGSRTNEIFIENGRFHGRQIAKALASKLKA